MRGCESFCKKSCRADGVGKLGKMKRNTKTTKFTKDTKNGQGKNSARMERKPLRLPSNPSLPRKILAHGCKNPHPAPAPLKLRRDTASLKLRSASPSPVKGRGVAAVAQEVRGCADPRPDGLRFL